MFLSASFLFFRPASGSECFFFFFFFVYQLELDGGKRGKGRGGEGLNTVLVRFLRIRLLSNRTGGPTTTVQLEKGGVFPCMFEKSVLPVDCFLLCVKVERCVHSLRSVVHRKMFRT